jgi:hypothetical protein
MGPRSSVSRHRFGIKAVIAQADTPSLAFGAALVIAALAKFAGASDDYTSVVFFLSLIVVAVSHFCLRR